jgi:hypothetical protein
MNPVPLKTLLPNALLNWKCMLGRNCKSPPTLLRKMKFWSKTLALKRLNLLSLLFMKEVWKTSKGSSSPKVFFQEEFMIWTSLVPLTST